MACQFRSLIWKEWHERKWALALCTGWIIIATIYDVSYELTHGLHGPVASFYSASFLYALLAAIFLAMRTSLGEVTQGTLGFSSSLPTSPRLLAWVRLGGALITLAGPILLGAVAIWALLMSGVIEQGPTRPNYGIGAEPLPQRPPLRALEAGNLLWKVTAINTASGVELLLILAVIGVRRRAESHLAFIGAFVAFAWMMLHFSAEGYRRKLATGTQPPWTRFLDWVGAVLPQSSITNYGYGVTDGSYGDLHLAHSIWMPLAANVLVLHALAFWFVRRYGLRVTRGTSDKRMLWRPPAILSRMPFRWHGRWSALVWLNLRQAVPMCLAGLVLACLLAALESSTSRTDDATLLVGIATHLCEGTFIVAILWSVVVGSAVFASELAPGLEQFWRSRPISPSAWFWVKFLGGLAAVVTVLDLVTILVTWNSRYPNQYSEMFSYIVCMPILHGALYAVAVCTMCWLRRPALAATAVVLFFFLITEAFDAVPGGQQLSPIRVYEDIRYHEERREERIPNLLGHSYPAVYGGLTALALTASLLAWAGIQRPREFSKHLRS